jgi:hypothetical protein
MMETKNLFLRRKSQKEKIGTPIELVYWKSRKFERDHQKKIMADGKISFG